MTLRKSVAASVPAAHLPGARSSVFVRDKRDKEKVDVKKQKRGVQHCVWESGIMGRADAMFLLLRSPDLPLSLLASGLFYSSFLFPLRFSPGVEGEKKVLKPIGKEH